LLYCYGECVNGRGRKLMQIDEAKTNTISDFLDGKTGRKWILLMGVPGTGKTTFMHAMFRSIIFANKRNDLGRCCRMVTASSLGEMMKNDVEGYKKLKASKVLFIDDVGFGGECEMVNNYGVKEKPVNDILEYRYDKMLHTVMTTNLSGEQLCDRYGERIYSRLREMCVTILFTGQDFRKL